ncbi:hypothetical protein V1514DRAFT_321989 [Lipomyces japonicus]|uniref:uncharacterized protein n=1 Tax=Lipomyces japonicus TaxID=56871 RepID=UPI0034CDBF0A
MTAIATDLMNVFFLLFKASVGRTPEVARSSEFVDPDHVEGVSSRMRALRDLCLTRDDHRCVITHKLDINQIKKLRRQGTITGNEEVEFLEVAHIIPHALLSYPDAATELAKRVAFQMLKMFNVDVVARLEGPNIDTPRNAITLTSSLYPFFETFKIVFEHVPDTKCTYRVDYMDPLCRGFVVLPVTVTFDNSPNRDIELPSRERLGIHRAIARILHLSAAGEYIDTFLEHMEDYTVAKNGSSPLDKYVRLRLAMSPVTIH